METLGSLIDKLAIVQLKIYHNSSEEKLNFLYAQDARLREELNDYIAKAFSGEIDIEELRAPQCKVYKEEGNQVDIEKMNNIGSIIQRLMQTNIEMWKNQDRLYDFGIIPDAEKDTVVNLCCTLNLERNGYMDEINEFFYQAFQKFGQSQEKGENDCKSEC